MKRLNLSLCLLLSAMAFQGFAVPSDSCLAGSTRLSTGETEYYRLYVPRNYSTQYRYPLVMCLHGIGERGNDNRAQVDREYMDHQWMLDSVKSKYKPFVLYPQCPANLEWENWYSGTRGTAAPAAIAAVNVIDSLCRVYPIDTTRLYVGGLSWGGMGTQGLMYSYPNKFAAAFPCAGETSFTTAASTFTKTAFWIFHGASDGTVPVTPDQDLVAACIAAGFPVVKFYSSLDAGFNITNVTGVVTLDSLRRAVAACSKYLYHEINNGDHGSGWHAAFFSPFLVPWLMSKSKVNGQVVCTWPAPGPAQATAVFRERQVTSPLSGNLRVTNGTVRWKGVSRLPARLYIYSAKGTLVMRHAISQRDGKLACSGLAEGVYLVEIDAGDWRERKTMTVH
jgi:predicted esterase